MAKRKTKKAEAQPEPRRRIRLITPPVSEEERSFHGHFAAPFAKPAQSGTYSPWAAVQGRRGR